MRKYNRDIFCLLGIIRYVYICSIIRRYAYPQRCWLFMRMDKKNRCQVCCANPTPSVMNFHEPANFDMVGCKGPFITVILGCLSCMRKTVYSNNHCNDDMSNALGIPFFIFFIYLFIFFFQEIKLISIVSNYFFCLDFC